MLQKSNTKVLLKCFGLLLITASISTSCIKKEGNQIQPNVLFIAIDDLNDWVGCLDGYPGLHTPNIDLLAERGVLFTNAHCAAPGCNSSRTALMTGISPTTSGVYQNSDEWRAMPTLADAITIPENFRINGYKVIGGGKIFHAYSWWDNKQGFNDPDCWDEYFPSKSMQMPDEVLPENMPVNTTTDFYDGYFDWAPMDIPDSVMADAKVVAWSEEQLSRPHDKPLFMAVGLYRPHVPWYVPQAYYYLHPLEEIVLPEIMDEDLADIPAAGQAMARQDWHQWITETGQWKEAVQGYLASISFTDAMLGRVIRALDEGPLSGNTIIVLWTDHGYHLGNKEHWEKFALWEQTTHVPLIFVDHRFDKASRCAQAVSLLDIYPTLAELCGHSVPDSLEGQSLVQLLRNPGLNTGRAVITTMGAGNHAIQDTRFRYIRYADGSEELYDHETDSNEFINLAGAPMYDSIIHNLSVWIPD